MISIENPAMCATRQPAHGLVAPQFVGERAPSIGLTRAGARCGELRALGLPGRARRVEERGHVAGLGAGGVDRVAAVEVVGVADHQRRRRVGDDVVDLRLLHLRVDGDGHAAGAATSPGTGGTEA